MCSSLDGSQNRARDQHRRHLRPGDALLTRRQQFLAQILEAHPAPQRQRQIDIAELPRALDPNALQAYRHRLMRAAVVEQLRLFRSADQMPRERAGFDPPVLVKLAEMRNRLLDHPPTDTNASYKAPITVDLAVLLANRVAQVHAPSEPCPQTKKIPKVVTTRSNRLRAPANRLIALTPPQRKS